jgi:HAE1 family hydrophobic/amphiphilic exporter-1
MIAGIAIRRPVATTMACVAVMLLGLVSYGDLAVDLLPDIGTPRITVMTRATGMAPIEIERLISVPLENQVSRVPNFQRVTSISREGMSVLTVVFPWGVDLDLAALHVRQAVELASDVLPESVDRPAVLRWDPGSEPVMGVAVAGAASLGRLRQIVEQVVVARVEQVQGIAGAQVTGGAEREIHIELEPDLLALYGVTVSQVLDRLVSANLSAQSGTVLQGAYRYSVRVLGEFTGIDEIATVPVGEGSQGSMLRISDVGTVSEGTRPRQAGALLNGLPAVGVLLYKESGVNTVEAVEAAEVALDELRVEYPELTLAVAFENASFIREAIDSVVQNIALGGLIAFSVLFLFLKDPRNPILLGVSIPVSLIATFVLCYFTGITLNIMTLGGLALGVGMLVDNSIVVLENIFRLRQTGLPADEAAERGTDEVAMAVTAATFTTIAVFLPIAYVHGVAGELFAPQAWTVTFALLASLVVSLTVLPMLAARFLRLEGVGARLDETPAASGRGLDEAPGSEESGDGEGPEWAKSRPRIRERIRNAMAGPKRVAGGAIVWIVALPLFWLRGLLWLIGLILSPVVAVFGKLYDAVAATYHAALEFCLRHRLVTVVAALALAVFSGYLAWQMPWELMPPINTGRFEAQIDAPPGTPYEELEAMVIRLDEAARGASGVRSTFATLGLETATSPGAASGAMALSPTRAFLTVIMEGERSRQGTGQIEAAMDVVRSTAAGFRNATLLIDAQRSPLQSLAGQDAGGFRVAIQGDDLDILEGLAQQAVERLRSIPGLDDVMGHTSRGNPEIQIRVKRDVATRYGVQVRQVTQALIGALQGMLATTQYAEFDRRVDIRVTAPGNEDGLASILDRSFPTPSGPVPLRELVEQTFASGPTEIIRSDRIREIPITATLTAIRLSEAVASARDELGQMSWPAGYRYRVAGEQEEVEASFSSLMWALLLSALLVYMVMASQFESLNHPFVIMLSLPLGWVGVILTLVVTGQSLNIVALIGAVVLTGVIVNDAIVKIDTINRLRREGYERRRAILVGSELRLRPILMTSVTTTCALIPMALGLGAGAELQQPLAIAIIGGESTGTLLTLLVIPVVYELFDREKKSKS